MTRLFVAMAAAVLGSAGAVRGQSACPEGRPASGDIGIERYRCVGGACQIWMETSLGRSHVFTTEPRIDRIDPAGPTADALQEGDVLVAVDRILITSPAGGRRLASLEPGAPVDLWIRRGDSDLDVRVVPVPGCNPSGLSVRIPDDP